MQGAIYDRKLQEGNLGVACTSADETWDIQGKKLLGLLFFFFFFLALSFVGIYVMKLPRSIRVNEFERQCDPLP